MRNSLSHWAYCLHAVYRRGRRALRHIGPLRSTYYLAFAIVDLLRDNPGRRRWWFDRELGRTVDPWNYKSGPKEVERHQTSLRIIDAACSGRLGRALEVGCCEGAFTEPLAQLCESVVAVDLSPIALARARARRDWDGRVQFIESDLVRDPLPGDFDLVVAMDVLVNVYRPTDVTTACAKLIESVRPGGYLFVENGKRGEVHESSWWSKRLMHGATWIDALLERDAALTVVQKVTTETHLYTLFRKTSDCSTSPPRSCVRPAPGKRSGENSQ